jgi:Tfp pilus assembly protein FimT
LTWLADVLRAEGCRVIEEDGWRSRGRPSSSGTFKPRAILHHWDASGPSSHGAISTVINGTGDAPGPLCSILTCRGNSDHPPSVHVIAAGRANHGGTGDGWGTIPRDDANTYAVGHEIAQTVDQPWPEDQAVQIHLAEAAILRRLSADATDSLSAHSEYAPGRKIDTTSGSHGQNMGTERATVQGIIDGGPGEDDLKHDFVRLSTAKDLTPSRSGTTITFDKEEQDTGSDHAAGNAGVTAPYNCTMSGVVQVNGSGRYAIEVKRYAGTSTSSQSYDESEGGWSSSAFANSWSAGDILRVVITALDDEARISNVRLFCDIIER